MAQKGEQALQRPLYVFDLPEEILATLTLKSHGDRPLPPATPTQKSTKEETLVSVDGDDGTPAKATSCNLCGLNFASVGEQRSHVRSDLHGYNLKQKIKGIKPVNEADFDKLIGDLDESISGSESSESDEDVDDADGIKTKDSTLSALLKKQAKLTDPEYDEFASRKRQRGPGKPPLLWFSTPTMPDNVSLGVYRAIFSAAEQEEEIHLVETLRKKQLPPTKPVKVPSDGGVALPSTEAGPHYFLCMIGGGHFAAMVVGLAPKMGKKHTGIDERSATVIAHKTFHRYTTRRKQGGSQSANDNAKGNAHSAGSSIRRYNEIALINEVRELLQSWKSLIDTAELIFVRATGSTNRRTLFGPYEGQVLRNNDPRNRGFPFSTRRATQKELMRAFVELTRVKQSTIDEAALAEIEKQNQSLATPIPVTKPKPLKPTKEEEEAALHTSQIVPLIKRSKVPALLNYLKTNNISPTFAFLPVNHHTPSPLHLAASLNSAPIVTALLSKGGADPTVMSDDARTPFTLAGDRATRDAFRVARHELGESAWDWEKAEVPTALSKVEADKRDAQEKAEKEAGSKAESERRKAETERVRKESEAREARRLENRLGKGKSLGALPVKSGADLREEQMRGLTPEARMRLERERRARAAEERFKRMQGGG